MGVRDRLRKDTARYLEPEEQIQAVFYAKRPSAQANDRQSWRPTAGCCC